MAATLIRTFAIIIGGYAIALFAPVFVPVAYTQDGPGDTCKAVYDGCYNPCLQEAALTSAAGSVALSPQACRDRCKPRWDACMRRKCVAVGAGQCNKDSECQRHCVETVSGQMGQNATVNCCSSLIGPEATVNPSCRQMIAGGDGALACVSDTACPTGQVRGPSGCVQDTQLPQPGGEAPSPGNTSGTPSQYTAEELLQGLDDADREAGAAMIENMRREVFGDDISEFQEELLRMGDFAADPAAPLPEGLTPQQEQAYQEFRRSWTELTQPIHLDPFTEPPPNYIPLGERTFLLDSYAPQTGFTPGNGSVGDFGSSFVGAAQDLGQSIIASPPVQAIQSATQAALNAARDLVRATTDSLGLTQPVRTDTTLADLAADPFGTGNVTTVSVIDDEIRALGDSYLAADLAGVGAEQRLLDLAAGTPGLNIYTGPELPGLENLSGITLNPDGTLSGDVGSPSPLAFSGLSSDPTGCPYSCVGYGSYDESGNPIVTMYQPGELSPFAIQAAAAEAGITGPFDVTWDSTGETTRYLASDIGTIADLEGSDTYWMDTGGADGMRTLGGAELRDTYQADVLRYSDTGEPVTDIAALERGPTTFVEEQPAPLTGTADIEEYARQLGLSDAEIATLRQEATAMQREIDAGRLSYDDVIADLNKTLDRVETERALMDGTIFGGDLGETGGIGGEDFPESATEKPPEVAYDEMLRGAENRLAAERDRVIEAEAALRTAEENSHPLRYAMDWTACTTGIGTCGGVPAAQDELDAARAAYDSASAEVDRLRDIPHSELARLQTEIDADLTQAELELSRLNPSADDIIRADEISPTGPPSDDDIIRGDEMTADERAREEFIRCGERGCGNEITLAEFNMSICGSEVCPTTVRTIPIGGDAGIDPDSIGGGLDQPAPRDTYMADVLRYSDTGVPVTDATDLARGPTVPTPEEQPATSVTPGPSAEEIVRLEEEAVSARAHAEDAQALADQRARAQTALQTARAALLEARRLGTAEAAQAALQRMDTSALRQLAENPLLEESERTAILAEARRIDSLKGQMRTMLADPTGYATARWSIWDGEAALTRRFTADLNARADQAIASANRALGVASGALDRQGPIGELQAYADATEASYQTALAGPPPGSVQVADMSQPALLAPASSDRSLLQPDNSLLTADWTGWTVTSQQADNLIACGAMECLSSTDRGVQIGAVDGTPEIAGPTYTGDDGILRWADTGRPVSPAQAMAEEMDRPRGVFDQARYTALLESPAEVARISALSPYDMDATEREVARTLATREFESARDGMGNRGFWDIVSDTTPLGSVIGTSEEAARLAAAEARLAEVRGWSVEGEGIRAATAAYQRINDEIGSVTATLAADRTLLETTYAEFAPDSFPAEATDVPDSIRCGEGGCGIRSGPVVADAAFSDVGGVAAGLSPVPDLREALDRQINPGTGGEDPVLPPGSTFGILDTQGRLIALELDDVRYEMNSDRARLIAESLGCTGACYTAAVEEARSASLTVASPDGGSRVTPGTAYSQASYTASPYNQGSYAGAPYNQGAYTPSGLTSGLGSGLGTGLGAGNIGGAMGGIGSAFQMLAQLAGMGGGQQGQSAQPPAPLPPIVVQPPPVPQPGTPVPDVLRPAVAVVANPNAIDVGETSTLIWTARRANECSVRYPSGELLAQSDSEGEGKTVPLFETTSFSITCSGDNGTGTATTTVYVGEQPPPSASSQTSQPAPTITATASTGGATSSPPPSTTSSGGDAYCDPALPIDAFITCLSRLPGANPNSVY